MSHDSDVDFLQSTTTAAVLWLSRPAQAGLPISPPCPSLAACLDSGWLVLADCYIAQAEQCTVLVGSPGDTCSPMAGSCEKAGDRNAVQNGHDFTERVVCSKCLSQRPKKGAFPHGLSASAIGEASS